MSLACKIGLITGAGSGLGKTYAKYMLQNGAKLMLSDVDDAKGLETTNKFQLDCGKDNVAYCHCDVTDGKSFEDLVKGTIQQFGTLDILINNAGIADETDNGWRKTVDINIKGVIWGTMLGFRYMGRNKGGNGGTIVNIASCVSLQPWENLPVYSCSKCAVNQITLSYGSELHYEDSCVRVVGLLPGPTDTTILDDVMKKGLLQEKNLSKDQALKGYGIQKVETMGNALIQVLESACNGTLWLVENDKPPVEVKLKYDRIC